MFGTEPLRRVNRQYFENVLGTVKIAQMSEEPQEQALVAFKA